MSKRKKIKNIQELALYKVCKLIPGLRWREVINCALEMLSDCMPDISAVRINNEILRKNLERMVREGVIRKIPGQSPLYYVSEEIEIELDEP